MEGDRFVDRRGNAAAKADRFPAQASQEKRAQRGKILQFFMETWQSRFLENQSASSLHEPFSMRIYFDAE